MPDLNILRGGTAQVVQLGENTAEAARQAAAAASSAATATMSADAAAASAHFYATRAEAVAARIERELCALLSEAATRACDAGHISTDTVAMAVAPKDE